MICRACNKLNDPDATFCAFCGASFMPVPSVTQPVATTGNFSFEPARPSTPLFNSLDGLAQKSSPAGDSVLDYNAYVEMLCQGQSYLAQMVIRFYYITGLKSYLVTDHGSFVVPNVQMTSAGLCNRIKQEMDALGYQELSTTLVRLKSEHLQTLPYLSRSMVRDNAGVIHNLGFFGGLVGLLRLYFEVGYGFLHLLVDLIKLVSKAISQSAGLAVQTVGRDDEDELLTGKRLMLASTYRKTRTFTYVRDVGPETYVGWFTHHEPLPSVVTLVVLTAAFVIGSFMLGLGTGYTFSFIFGSVGAVLYVFAFIPWLLTRLKALPQPRYLSGLTMLLAIMTLGLPALAVPLAGIVTVFYPLVSIFFGFILSALGPLGLLGRGGHGPSAFPMGNGDALTMLLMVGGFTVVALPSFISLIVFFKTTNLSLSHFDQFDAETHAKIVKERMGLILAQQLESSGYTPEEISNILEQKMPGAGRYRRARS